jgi:hypothetical protein
LNQNQLQIAVLKQNCTYNEYVIISYKFIPTALEFGGTLPNLASKLWVFMPPNLWVIGFQRFMGFLYGTDMVDTQNAWGIADYGVSELWVKTALTVMALGGI